MPDTHPPASPTETACLELLAAALDGDDLARIDLVMRLCLIENDAARCAGAARMTETSEPLRVVLL